MNFLKQYQLEDVGIQICCDSVSKIAMYAGDL